MPSRSKHQVLSWRKDMIEFGKYAADLVDANPDNFRIFGPDETKSNRLQEVFTRTSRQWLGRMKPDYDEALSPAGRVIDSQLSEHQAEGMLEGYVLTGRHGFFASYESFLRVVDSMITQHFKWLRKSKTHTTWRKNYPGLELDCNFNCLPTRPQWLHSPRSRYLDSLG